MNIAKYYRCAVMLPGLVILISHIIFEICSSIFGEEYKSEWFTNGFFVFYALFIIMAHALFVGFLSLPILFNDHIKIRTNRLMSFLTWFVSPAIWFFYIWIKHFHYLSGKSYRPDSESAFIFSNTIPYAIGLIWTFIRFRKDVKRELTEKKLQF
jgi:hypothetical protein